METAFVAVETAESMNAEQILEPAPDIMHELNLSVQIDVPLILSQTGLITSSIIQPTCSLSLFTTWTANANTSESLKLENSLLHAEVARLTTENAQLTLIKQRAANQVRYQNRQVSGYDDACTTRPLKNSVAKQVQKLENAEYNPNEGLDELRKSFEEELQNDDEERIALSARLHKRNQRLQVLLKRFYTKISPSKKRTVDFGQNVDCVMIDKASCGDSVEVIQLDSD